MRKFAGILLLGQLILAVFLVAPYIQFHDEQAKVKNQEAIGKSGNTYFQSVTNADKTILVQGATSNLTIIQTILANAATSR